MIGLRAVILLYRSRVFFFIFAGHFQYYALAGETTRACRSYQHLINEAEVPEINKSDAYLLLSLLAYFSNFFSKKYLPFFILFNRGRIFLADGSLAVLR